MNLFKHIQIQTQTGCNLKCPMCPNSYMKQPEKSMTLDLFNKIIDELAEINYDGRVSLYLMNEPFLDTRLQELVRITRERLPNARINISTNGVLIDEIDLPGLSDCAVSCYSEAIWNKWKDKDVNAIDMRGHVYKYYNRGGNIEAGDDKVGGYCERPFTQMYINAFGQSILCCSDYKFEVVLGDVSENTLVEIWQGDKYNKYREVLKTNKREGLKLCQKCNYQ